MMKKKELINIIERLVRKEVKKQVNEIFINEGKKALASRSIVNDEVSSSLTQLAEQEYTQPKPKKKEFKEYTKNDALNKVLNETVGGIPQGDSEYPTMGGGTFDTSKMADALGYGNMLGNAETKRQASAIQTAQAAGADTSNPAVQDVMSNLTKDYRGVMAALDKKDGKK